MKIPANDDFIAAICNFDNNNLMLTGPKYSSIISINYSGEKTKT